MHKYYHKRKKKQAKANKQYTGTEDLLKIFPINDEHVALISVNSAGSRSTLTAMVQYFAVSLILFFSGGSLGTTTSPQQQTDASKLKDLCQVRNA